MKWHHILLVVLIFIIIFSMLVWTFFDDPAPDIDETPVPAQLNGAD